MNDIWADLHQSYRGKDWIDKPSIFAETASQYFPKNSKILELGAGQAQDSRYFADLHHSVISTDLETSAQDIAKSKLSVNQKKLITFRQVDLRDTLPFNDELFDVVYAHLSLHYFNYETTLRLFGEIQRVLKPGGILAFLVNSVNDPEYKTGKEIEPDYYQIGKTAKRYFSENTVREFTKYLQINLLDELGETYKDSAKGVHNLVRFIGTKPADLKPFKQAIPYVGAIVERTNNGVKELLLQTRWKPHADKLYSGTLEFPAGVLDKPYENIYKTIARELREETGLTLKSIKNDNQTNIFRPNDTDEIFAFKPFCCTQQLKAGKPWIGFIFVCEVEDGTPRSQLSETKDVKWLKAESVKELYFKNPEKFFGLELPAWEYYFRDLYA